MRFIKCPVILAAALTAAFASSTARATPLYTLTNLTTFPPADGAYTYAGLTTDSHGNLYGVNSQGTVFEIAAGTHAVTNLASVTGANGSQPKSTLIADSSGNLYGTASFGGPYEGDVFEVAAGTHAVTAFDFPDGGGIAPESGLIADASGNLYGTASGGGSFGYGCVYEVAAGTHVITTLASFNNNNNLGVTPYGSLYLDANGNLYGTARSGGSTDGTVFKVAANTHALTAIAAFNGSNGVSPYGGLIADASGNLYGTTELGGAGYGTVFKVNPVTDAFTTLLSFNGTDGSDPYDSLIFDSKGNLYGTTSTGGEYGYGTVFELNPATEVVTTLFSFDGIDGGSPYAGLIMDNSGDLYGTTEGVPGNLSSGTVFELSPVPEPSSLALALLALGGWAYWVRTKIWNRLAGLLQESAC